ncbi:MAG: efflux RND transporter periplasmic adaptor subunit [Gammaproteobacteria bacterium]|nr:efflux RND transporter periplasmic adaptor subunit [Gammaproteobacteria bacterium]
MKSPLAISAFLLLASGAAIAADEPKGPPPAPVQLADATKTSMAPQAWLPGTVVSKQDARIAAEVSGRLVMLKEVGEEVKAGEIIARVDGRALELEQQRTAATIARLKASLSYQSKQLSRLEKLAAVNGAARTQLDEAQSAKAMAEQELAEAEASHAGKTYDLERTQIRAPYNGRVVERLAQPGEFLAVGTPVARLVDTEHLEIRVVAPLYLASFLQEGLIVPVKDQTRSISSPIRSLVPVGDEQSRMFEARVVLEPGIWPIGSPVRVALPSGESREVVAVPRDALILRENATYVFKVNGKMVAERVSVQAGSGMDGLVAVDGEIQPGDKVVVRGGESLQPGQAVKSLLN